MILITGAAGFIGANFVLDWLGTTQEAILALDKLTYAGNIHNLAQVQFNPNFRFVQGDINDAGLIRTLLSEFKPRAIINFAAESHVDRSIHNPANFIDTNINGVFNLLEAAREYWQRLKDKEAETFRFLQISTDEVYGSLDENAPPFTESTPYAPNSPYAASKAAADHLVRAYYHTYALPTLTTNCSNNYGPFQFPEKLIPLMILNALAGRSLPLYGDGLNIRDWLHVQDHCAALKMVLKHGRVGESYNIGGNKELKNIEITESICEILQELCPHSNSLHYQSLITFVKDRPGHDRRYAIDSSKIAEELGWEPQIDFELGLRDTVIWYLSNKHWVDQIKSGDYLKWLQQHYQGEMA